MSAAGDELVECRFCGLFHLGIDDKNPGPGDDGEWRRLAQEHEADCAWIRERKQESSSGR
jgi:hypothetical protein